MENFAIYENDIIQMILMNKNLPEIISSVNFYNTQGRGKNLKYRYKKVKVVYEEIE